MTYNFNTIPQRRDTDSVKWNFFDEDVLPMWVADMDFLSPPPVIEALRERVDQGVFGYPYLLEESKEAMVRWLEKRHGWRVEAEDLVFLPGVVTGFNLATHAVTERPICGRGITVPATWPRTRSRSQARVCWCRPRRTTHFWRSIKT